MQNNRIFVLFLSIFLFCGCSLPIPSNEGKSENPYESIVSKESIRTEVVHEEMVRDFQKDASEGILEKETQEEQNNPEKGVEESFQEKQEAMVEQKKEENIPEQVIEKTPLPTVHTLSIYSKELSYSMQKGLMDKKTNEWEWSGIFPAGQHQIAFALNGDASQLLGRILHSSSFPFSGDLEPSSGFSFSLPKISLVAIKINVGNHSWSLGKEEVSQAKAILVLKNQSVVESFFQEKTPGNFVLEVNSPSEVKEISFELEVSGKWEKWGSPFDFTKSGAIGTRLVKNGKSFLVSFQKEVSLEIRLWPLHRKVRVVPLLKNPITFFQTQVQKIQLETQNTVKQQMLEKLEALLQEAKEFPLLEKGKHLFFARSSTQKMFLAGDFNQWSATQDPMNSISGTDGFWIEKTLPATYAEYKFVNDQNVWVQDSNNPKIAYNSIATNSVVNTKGSGKSHLEERKSYASRYLGNSRDLVVYVPADAVGNVESLFPVLYMHDGQNLFSSQAMGGGWGVKERVDTLIQQKKIKPLFVIGVANTPGRMDEYTHVADQISGQTVGGKASLYGQFLTEEVKMWVDSSVESDPRRRSTGVMGSSLGGLVSFWLGMNQPEYFYRVAAISSTFGWGKLGANNPTLLELLEQKKEPLNWVLYMDSGSPQDNYQVTLQMKTILEKKLETMKDVNFHYWLESGASHNEAAWNKRLYRSLEFLFSW